MGLKIHSIAEIPDGVSRSYYMYVLDYYNWDEPIGNTLRENFDRMAEFASKNDAVVIQPIGESHFYSELMSWESINGMKPEELLPAILITSIHPKHFLAGHDQHSRAEHVPEDELIFLQLRDTCKQPADVITLIQKIFTDIKERKQIRNFQVAKQQNAGIGGALVNALVLEPNFAGIGIDLKKIFSAFKRPNT